MIGKIDVKIICTKNLKKKNSYLRKFIYTAE